MRSPPLPLLLAGALALATVVACSDGDPDATDVPDGGASSSSSSSSGGVDGGTTDGAVPPDGSTSGCTFASYVIGLVTSSTTATAVPDTTLGAGCTDSTSQDEFKSLFP